MWILLLLWAIGANWIAYSSGYYRFPKQTVTKKPIYITIGKVLGVFGIYLFVAIIVIPFAARFILYLLKNYHEQTTSLSIPVAAALQCGAMLLILISMMIFIYSQDRILFAKIWREKASPLNSFKDFGLGIITWFLSFPLVTILGEVIEAVVLFIFGPKSYEQAAVRFMKLASASSFSLIFALIAVIILAPLIEEFLFRGVLQTYVKKYLGIKAAILLSSLAFALFHFYRDQGVGNISLILSLFFLGGYLGFIYERQGSLWASIGLHMTFNSISALRILFLPEI